MGFSAGSLTVATSVKVSGTVPAPGNAPSNPLTDPTTQSAATPTQTLLYGTSSGLADVFCAGSYTLAALGTITLNLYDGGATTSDLVTLIKNEAANLRTARGLVVTIASGGDTSGVRVGGAASNIFGGWFADTSDKQDIFPSGPALIQGSPAGKPVTSSAKNLKIENLGAVPVTVSVFVAGSNFASGYAMGVLGLTYA